MIIKKNVELRMTPYSAEMLCVALMEWLDAETESAPGRDRRMLNFEILAIKRHLEELLKETS